jgi:two-component system cell cycle sensor histidine kinase/response regulator CckA
VIWVQLHSRLIGEGADARFENALIDITQQKKLEGQFIQAQKMEAVGRLAGGIAHDFNNMLTVIRSYCDLVLLELPATATNRGDLEEIAGAADRASALARQLLAFSRRQVLVPQVLDPNAVVEQVKGILHRVVPSAVKFSTRLAGDLGSIRADPGHIDQLLMNLAINATDAMPNGGRLSIETANATLDETYAARHSGLQAGDYIMIAVSDTGTGMDEATRARIFEPFFTTKAPGKGTGLGLATVFAIVEQNHGHIWVYSEVGQGTTFKIYFPRVAEAAQALPSRGPAALLKQTGMARTVLVVEDDDAVRGTIATVLERQGYRVLQAHHGGEGLHVSETHDGAIDLVISDVMTPELGGREFVERLVETRSRTRVLLMSGYTDDDILQRGLINPAFAFMEKPFAVEQLIRKVEEVLT